MAVEITAPKATNTNPIWWQNIDKALDNAYQGIISNLTSPFKGLTQYLKKGENPDRIKIDALRQKHYDLIANENNQANPDYAKVTKIISADTKQFMQEIIDEEIKKLGAPPCKFSVVTLGSMARQECGPVTDLEIGFITEEKTVESYKYFYKLGQNLSDRLFLLGEHPDIGGKGMRMDEADNAPPHLRFFARNLTPEQAQKLMDEAIMNRDWKKIPYEGSRPFLATAEEFANYSQTKFVQNKKQLKKQRREMFEKEWAKAIKDPKNKEKLKTQEGKKQLENEIHFWLNQMYRPFSTRELKIANDAGKKLGRNMALLHGDKGLYNKFHTKRQQIFSQKNDCGKSGRQALAKDKMAEDVRDAIQKGKHVYVTGKLDKTLDVKRELYRFVEQFVTNLGFYHRCKSQNTVDIANELIERKILSPEFGAKLIDFIQFATGLRLKEQAIMKRQGYAAYLDQTEFDEDKTKLEKEMKYREEAIEYMEKLPSSTAEDKQAIALKRRELAELKIKYEHMLDMAPGKIISAQDLQLLKDKYLPVAQEIFKAAQSWTQGKERLGFADNVEASISPQPAGMLTAFNNDKAAQKSASKQDAVAPQDLMNPLVKMFLGM